MEGICRGRLPTATGDAVRVRIEFVADNWRIDQLALGEVAGRASFRHLPLARVDDVSGAEHDAALENLRRDDGRYVVTKPGDALQLRFDAGTVADGRQRTFFLAASGYPILSGCARTGSQVTARRALRPVTAAVLDALYRWRDQRDGLRSRFGQHPDKRPMSARFALLTCALLLTAACTVGPTLCRIPGRHTIRPVCRPE
ncbi:MAG: hypothetical protein U5K76_09175 [Woeseiaceae bacterium]|nr:hypothetical protein [Woeseiaceae bacterium]